MATVRAGRLPQISRTTDFSSSQEGSCPSGMSTFYAQAGASAESSRAPTPTGHEDLLQRTPISGFPRRLVGAQSALEC
ncbi:unnamed protein product [Prorocentrum cordatum]|nr:unnamed protein product [Polarella glacialis]